MKKGFTLIELLVVIAIIGLLASVVLVSMSGLQGKAKITKTLEFSQSLQRNLGAYAVGIWGFDEGSGTVIKDGSGYNNNGTLMNGPTFTSDTPHLKAEVGAGKYALSFDGVNAYVSFGQPASLELSPNSFTLEVWIYPRTMPAAGTNPSVISSVNANGGANSSGYEIALNGSTNRFRFAIDAAGQSPALVAANSAPQLNTWQHIVGVNDGGTMKMYVNGVLQTATAAAPASFPMGRNVTIGEDSWGANLDGLIDEVRIYEKALSLGEIQKRYADGLQSYSLVLE